MKQGDWKKQIPVGSILARSSDRAASVEIPVGHGDGRIVLHVTFPSEHDRDHAHIHLRWEDRPGDPVSVQESGSDFIPTDKNYLAHARLDVRSGEVEPGWQA